MATFDSYENSINMISSYYGNSGTNLVIPDEIQISLGTIPDEFINQTFSEYARLWLLMSDSAINNFINQNPNNWNLYKESIKTALKAAKASRVL